MSRLQGATKEIFSENEEAIQEMKRICARLHSIVEELAEKEQSTNLREFIRRETEVSLKPPKFKNLNDETLEIQSPLTLDTNDFNEYERQDTEFQSLVGGVGTDYLT